MAETGFASTPANVYQTFSGLGGARGWPPHNWLWRIGGAIDRLFGGVGMSRGRRHPDQLREGEALDFWRVEAIEPDSKLRLRAEMKLPGRGWLQYEVIPSNAGKTELTQTAYFAPKGLFGLIYWYGIYPLHGFIFAKTIEEIARRAETSSNRNYLATGEKVRLDDPERSISIELPPVSEG